MKGKQRVARTRNHGTQTESQFWEWVRKALRAKSMQWKPRQEAKKRARRENQSGSRHDWEFQCAHCKNWFVEAVTVNKKRIPLIEMDHIVEAGTFSKDTAGEFIDRLFCEVDGWQVLCKQCHSAKTHGKGEG